MRSSLTGTSESRPTALVPQGIPSSDLASAGAARAHFGRSAVVASTGSGGHQSPRLGATGTTGGSSLAGAVGAPQLLQQMELMLGATLDLPGIMGSSVPVAGAAPPASSFDLDAVWDEMQPKLRALETVRSVVALFVSGCGQYQPILGKLFVFIFGFFEELQRNVLSAKNIVAIAKERARVAEALTMTPSSRSFIPPEQHFKQNQLRLDGGDAGASSTDLLAPDEQDDGRALAVVGDIQHDAVGIVPSDQPQQRAEVAHARARRLEQELKRIVGEATAQKERDASVIEQVTKERERLADLIEYQTQRARRRALDPGSENRERLRETAVTCVELERTIEGLHASIDEQAKEMEEQKKRIRSLLELNGKYARQTVELAARIRVYNEHNEKFATLLSMQYDERLATERENEALRASLLDLDKFNQLRTNVAGEHGSTTIQADLRTIRFGRGANPTVPRHLHHAGLMNRITLSREAALALVSDIVYHRGIGGAAKKEFQTYILHHLTVAKKFGNDALAWAYALDEACQLQDSDVNLVVYRLVSNRLIGEGLYMHLLTDIAIFVEACEICDKLQHGEIRMTVPVIHVMGILGEMFPSYPDSAFKRILDQLQATLTSGAHAHYRMLFPNLERDELLKDGRAGETPHHQLELRKENGFSATFKELIVDDAVVSMQLIEDEILKHPNEKVTVADCLSLVGNVVEDKDVAADVGRIVKGALCQSFTAQVYEVVMHKTAAIATLRAKTVIRRGPYRPSNPPTAMRAMLSNQAPSEYGAMMPDEAAPINYRQVIQSTSTRRLEDGDSTDDSMPIM